jgi:hypothetical protein
MLLLLLLKKASGVLSLYLHERDGIGSFSQLIKNKELVKKKRKRERNKDGIVHAPGVYATVTSDYF